MKTPNWPFTAIRLANGNTLINCTYGHVSIEVDKAGKTVWQVDNTSFDKPLIKDACGGQRLPNGNTVIACYGIGADRTKMIEVTPEKKWFGALSRRAAPASTTSKSSTRMASPSAACR